MNKKDVKVIKTFKYKLYTSSKNKELHNIINISAGIYNYCINLHRLHYKYTKKHLSKYTLSKYLTIKKRNKQYQHWNLVPSQAIQEITE